MIFKDLISKTYPDLLNPPASYEGIAYNLGITRIRLRFGEYHENVFCYYPPLQLNQVQKMLQQEFSEFELRFFAEDDLHLKDTVTMEQPIYGVESHIFNSPDLLPTEKPVFAIYHSFHNQIKTATQLLEKSKMDKTLQLYMMELLSYFDGCCGRNYTHQSMYVHHPRRKLMQAEGENLPRIVTGVILSVEERAACIIYAMKCTSCMRSIPGLDFKTINLCQNTPE